MLCLKTRVLSMRGDSVALHCVQIRYGRRTISITSGLLDAKLFCLQT